MNSAWQSFSVMFFTAIGIVSVIVIATILIFVRMKFGWVASVCGIVLYLLIVYFLLAKLGVL